MFCCKCGQGALVGPLHYNHFVLAVCVDITFLPLQLAAGMFLLLHMTVPVMVVPIRRSSVANTGLV